MLRRFRLPAFVAAAALLAGCFQVESVLSVRADGSATLTEEISADGMMGLMLRKSVSELDGADLEDRYGSGVRVVSTEQSVVPGAVRITTVYDVPDVTQLRYDLANAFDADEMGSAVGTELDGDGDDSGDDSGDEESAFLFGFTPATGGAPAQLRVTVPPMGDITDMETGLGDSPLGDMLGTENAGPRDAFDEMMVMMGNMSMRFSIQTDGLLDTDAGWADGDRVALADVSVGTFLEYLLEEGLLEGPPESMNTPNDGFDLPGYRIAPAGTTTIRFR